MKALHPALIGLGKYGFLILDVGRDLLRHGVNPRELTRQIVRIGSSSLPIVILTSLFTGMVLALQTAYGLHRFGAKDYVGNIVGLAIVRELGPVLTAVMLCGRVGAGITAEVASMVVTEQVDAIRALGASAVSKLVTPKIIAAIIALPLLTVVANFFGVYGGGVIAVFELNISGHMYFNALRNMIVIRDLVDGLIKSAVFGFLLSSIACYKGLYSRGGTEGVGLTTTSSVVTGSMVIFIADFFITKLLLMIG